MADKSSAGADSGADGDSGADKSSDRDAEAAAAAAAPAHQLAPGWGAVELVGMLVPYLSYTANTFGMTSFDATNSVRRLMSGVFGQSPCLSDGHQPGSYRRGSWTRSSDCPTTRRARCSGSGPPPTWSASQ